MAAVLICLFLITNAVNVDSNKKQCAGSVDTEVGSSMYWEPLPANNTMHKPCPAGAVGNVTRLCVEEEGDPVWKPPDVTDCHNTRLEGLWDTGEKLLNSNSVYAEMLITFMDDLSDLLGEASANETLYPYDLHQSVSLMHQTASKTDAMRSDDSGVINDFTQTFGEAISAICDPGTMDTWRNFGDQHSIQNYAMDVLDTMSRMALNIMHNKRAGKHLTSLANNLNFDIQVSDKFEEDIPEPGENISAQASDDGPQYRGYRMDSAGGSTSIIFTEEVLNISRHRSGLYSSKKGLFRAEFFTLSQLLHMDFTRNDTAMDTISNATNNASVSRILTAQVLNMADTLYSDLTIPVVITYLHQQQDMDRVKSVACVFLNESGLSVWSSAGCVVAGINSTHVTCHCYHLTNFALIMDFYQMNISAAHERALSFISYVGGTLSVMCCGVSVTVYQILRLQSERIKVHQMLAVCIILTQLTFFIGFDRTQNKAVCKALAVLLHYLLTCLFCWMLVEGIHLYMSLIKVFRRKNHFTKYMALGWGLPAVNVLISAGVFMDEYAAGDYCWMSTKLLLTGFLPFVVLTLTANTLVLVLVLRVMLNSLRVRDEDYVTAKVGVKAVVVLLPLLGLTWVLGFLSVGSPGTLVFTYLFTLCNSLQGVFFFLFHCLMNHDVQKAFRRKYLNKNRHGQVPDASTSKTGGGVSTLSNHVVEGDSVRRIVHSQKHSTSSLSLSATSSDSSWTHQTQVDGSASECGSKEDFLPAEEHKITEYPCIKSEKELYNVVAKQAHSLKHRKCSGSSETDSEKYDSVKVNKSRAYVSHTTGKTAKPVSRSHAMRKSKPARPGTPPAIRKNGVCPQVVGEGEEYMEWALHGEEELITIQRSEAEEAGHETFVIHI